MPVNVSNIFFLMNNFNISKQQVLDVERVIAGMGGINAGMGWNGLKHLFALNEVLHRV